jgi:hypothetical protein
MKLAVRGVVEELDWAGIEVAEVDDNNFVQMCFANTTNSDDYHNRVYLVIGKKQGKWFEVLFDDPEFGVNKSRAYELYWELEEKLFAL